MTKFRNLTVEDLDALVRWRNDPAVTRFLADRLKTREQAAAWFHTLKAQDKIWLKAIIEKEKVIGYGQLESIDEKNRRCELVLVIGEIEYWGKGIGTYVLKMMLQYAIDTLHMHRVWAVMARGNDRSERLVKKAGFLQEGVMRETIIIGDKYSDLLCFSILEDEYKARKNQN
jgi:RimJ/RimL family protein N-acetyltransferase